MQQAWPVVGLAAVQVVDAVLCRRPAPFIARCLDDVHFARRWWPVLTPLKSAAAAGLVAGVWWPPLAAATAGCLVAYFVVAIGAHVRARDFGRNLFLNAAGMLGICAATFVHVVRSL